MILADAVHGLSEGASHADPGAFRSGARPSIPAAQADGAGQLADQPVTLGLGLGGPFIVPHGLRFLYILVYLSKPLAVGILGLGVQ
jgi:hypothetical protein